MNLHVPDLRVLEVHPATNLHDSCQPSSVLEEREELGLALLLQVVKDAANLGYNFLHVAGEEPLRYPGLQALSREAHQYGMLTSAIVRNTVLTAAQLEWLRFSVDLLGVEVTGKGERTGRSRRRRATRTGQTAEGRVAVVRASGIPFAIVFPLTTASLEELEWAVEFAAAQGAALLQIRPSPELTGEQMATAWMMVEWLADMHRGKLVIHIDTVNRYNLRREPQDLAAWKMNLERDPRSIGEMVSPLVIENDGTVSPLRHGFPRRFALGNLHQRGLARLAPPWIALKAGAFCEAYGTALRKAQAEDRVFADLYAMIAQVADGGGNGMANGA